MDLSLIIQLISGIVGGNAAGAALKEKSLGVLGNSLAGLVGGGLGGQIIQALLGIGAAGGADWTSAPSSPRSPVAGSAVAS